MVVSRQHERLVGHLIRWVEDKYSNRKDLCIYADHIDWPTHTKPIVISNHIPDLYAVGVTKPLTVLGEAETSRSIEEPHADEQISAFVDFLSIKKNPVLVIAVPWASVPRARSLIRNALRRRGYPSRVISFSGASAHFPTQPVRATLKARMTSFFINHFSFISLGISRSGSERPTPTREEPTSRAR